MNYSTVNHSSHVFFKHEEKRNSFRAAATCWSRHSHHQNLAAPSPPPQPSPIAERGVSRLPCSRLHILRDRNHRFRNVRQLLGRSLDPVSCQPFLRRSSNPKKQKTRPEGGS